MQLNRQGIKPVIFERNRIGGLLWNANLVENYPGFVNGITGPDLVKLFQDQAQHLGVEVVMEEVIKAEFQDNKFRIATRMKDYMASILVAATGTAPITHSFGNLPENVGERIITEISPIFEIKDKHVVIIGAGDASLDYALNLSRHNRITILNRGTRIKGLKLLWERVERQPEISYFQEIEVTGADLNSEGRLTLQVNGEKKAKFECDYLITAIGRKPDYSFADESIMGNREKLIADNRLFLIGDLVNGSFRQTTIAVADGIRAAMVIGDLLEKG
jgi:thioredoxin reductase